MATEGLRRSTRARKPVKSYAVEQAQEKLELHTQPPKRKRKKVVDEDDYDEEADLEIAQPAKKTSKKSKAPDVDDESIRLSGKNYLAEASAPKSKGSKAKRTTSDRGWHASAAERKIAVSKRNVTKLRPGAVETRLKSFVKSPPTSYHNALKRANTQRMFVLDRERGTEEDCHALHHDCPYESVQLAGSTGNVYTVTISHVPTCTCPVGIFHNKNKEELCKHALYVLHNVLKAPDHLKQQNAFLTSELREIFANAPAMPTEAVEDEPMDGNRKPLTDDCPICFMEFEDGEESTWCRAACGNNIHTACFEQWARTKGHNVTCPFCRAQWEYEGPKKQKQKMNVASVAIPDTRGEDGYRNVRDQLDYD